MKKIGKIVNVKGLKGEVKILSSSDFKDVRFTKGSIVYIKEEKETKELIVSKWYVHKNFDIIKFKDINYIDEAKKIVNFDIYGEELEDDVLDEGEYFFDDLIDFEIYENGQLVGKVLEIFDQINRSYLKVQKENKKTFLLPFVDEFIKNVDLSNKKIDVELIEGLLDD